MPSFTVRVVLHDADWNDYDTLYEAMNDEGFNDEISVKGGKKYKMPDGEYNISGPFTSSDVVDKARNAAKKTRKKHAVLVTQATARSMFGLESV